MPEIWRGMKIDGAQPALGAGGAHLGIRAGPGEHDDIQQDEAGRVHPGRGGMSVSPSVDTLPPHRLPRRLRDAYPDRFPEAKAPNTLHCWRLGEGAFAAARVADRLVLRLDPEKPERHGFVEPDATMMLQEYESALVATRDQWRRWEG
jgi:hypothetical protein